MTRVVQYGVRKILQILLQNCVTNGGEIVINTFLSDDVINCTQLRNNQKHWLDRAYISPVSVKSGAKILVLINRDYAKDMYLLNHYAGMILQFCQELNSEQVGKSDVFPWIKHLSEEEIADFYGELLSTFKDITHSRNWLALEEVISSWQATAEAITNPEMLELLNSDLDSEEFTTVE